MGSKKHKGPNAKLREKVKGANQGPKRVGVTKPPSGLRPAFGVGCSKLSKKAKKAAATAAAWALIGGSDKHSSGSKKKHTYY